MSQVQTLLNQVPPEACAFCWCSACRSCSGSSGRGARPTPATTSSAGVRTFPLIGLLGYGAGAGGRHAARARGARAAGGRGVHGGVVPAQARDAEDAGVTTEITGLLTYVLGALVFYGNYWIATTVVRRAMLLLELKVGLESLSERIPSEEVVTFTKFLLLTAVILPAVPNQDFGPFHLNPFKTWLVVVAVCGISYGSYVLQRVTRQRGGIVLAALLGGAYSSTVMTVVLARRAKRENRPHLFSGSMLMASGMMFLRLVLLLAIFNEALMRVLARVRDPRAGDAAGRAVVDPAGGRQPERAGARVRGEEPPRAAVGLCLRRHLRGAASWSPPWCCATSATSGCTPWRWSWVPSTWTPSSWA